MKRLQPAVLTIFGGTGDLAYRKLYPALYELYKKNQLSENFAIIGTARREWTNDHLREVVIRSIGDNKENTQHVEKFASHFYYQSHDVTDTDNYVRLKALIETLEEKYQTNGHRIFYLSVSPRLFGTISHHLKSQHLETCPEQTRLVIEKPFGSNYNTSKQLNDEIMENFTEQQIYRVDHYLEKEWIQAIIPFRFSNPLIEKIWDKESIASITITLDEIIGIGERGSYFDETGALRDMFQNHILQLLSLLLMNMPHDLSGDAISQAKTEALLHLEPIDSTNVDERIIRGQYIKNEHDLETTDYRQEKDVSEHSQTETFVAGKLYSNDHRWQHVPIYFRTGKYLTQKATRVDILLKKTNESLYSNQCANYISILIDPEQSIEILLNGKKAEYTLETDALYFKPEETIAPADDYEKLLYHVFVGDRAHFVHWNELAASWKFVDKIIASWQTNDSPLYEYKAHTIGPEAAVHLLDDTHN
ncbi:glucose-6-phosphate dehydrogenase [Allofustis seminis]|uniref:glucose-6-phosphate dehydrogenase n=1 Tax=Allofustis seminis TaxID=166939 RepID=UPI00037546AE|nr:glucose-6-phosphate dehydrogenase [Allofustis seminis]